MMYLKDLFSIRLVRRHHEWNCFILVDRQAWIGYGARHDCEFAASVLTHTTQNALPFCDGWLSHFAYLRAATTTSDLLNCLVVDTRRHHIIAMFTDVRFLSLHAYWTMMRYASSIKHQIWWWAEQPCHSQHNHIGLSSTSAAQYKTNISIARSERRTVG